MKNKTTISVAFLCLVFLFHGLNAQTLVPDVTVSLDGEVTSIQAAIDAAPANSDRPWVIYIREGIYDTEKLIIPSGKDNITLVGESRENTVISYHIYDCSGGLNNKCPAEDVAKWSGDNIRTSATLTIIGNDFRAENLTIQNTAGPVGQALAITVKGDRNIFINCNFIGYQDTIYLWDGGKRSYFEGCLVVGRTDYIYGGGIAWFETCEIRSYGGGWITAPSTPETQEFGYVFNNCTLTYATGSPRSGDDGALVALGRPWHNFPKVTWMNSYFPAEIHPEGWPTIWSMDYAPTSDKLELYEYNNTGPGADMSGRADWVGIREITDAEAAEITIENVFNGWDPTAEAPLVKTYTWNANGENNSWLLAENWDPSGDETSGIPAAGEAASADGTVQLEGNGGSFAADLALSNGAVLYLTENSTVNFLTLSEAEISVPATEVSLDGRVATKGNSKFTVPSSGVLKLNANLSGMHTLSKEGAGKVILPSENVNFSGTWIVAAGILEADAANSLGKASVEVKSGASLAVGNENALQPTSSLKVEGGAKLVLNATVVLSEFFIDDQIQTVGEYTSTTHPDLVSGSGKIVVGRPEQFIFIGGKWDDVTKFSPQLLPEAGEKVLVEGEMETTSTVFVADMVLTSKGNIRMRGDHTSTGEIEMQTGSKINYATSGPGFNLIAPINVSGDVTMEMNSGNEAGNSLTLSGNIRGEGKVTVYNHGGDPRVATLKLTGDNSIFSGSWDLTRASRNATATTAIEGLSANAFGTGSIVAGAGTEVIFSHSDAVNSHLNLTLNNGAVAILNEDVVIETLILNGETMTEGVYSMATHPNLFEGAGSFVVGNSEISNDATLLKDLISKGIKIYPIPATTELNFSNAGMLRTINISDVNGKLLASKTVNEAGVLMIKTADLANGLYILTAYQHNGIVLKGKFIKK